MRRDETRYHYALRETFDIASCGIYMYIYRIRIKGHGIPFKTFTHLLHGCIKYSSIIDNYFFDILISVL